MKRNRSVWICLILPWLGGCGDVLVPLSQNSLFYLPMAVEGESIGLGFVDTGGEFEVLLRQPYGLDIVGEVDVLTFRGSERVDVTEPFVYTFGSVTARTSGAIVGLSSCICNGVGFQFFNKTGLVLGLDFSSGEATLLDAPPPGGVVIPFASPPADLSGFDSTFLSVEVTGPDGVVRLAALLDTGATTTILRRGLVGSGSPFSPDRLDVTVGHPSLGLVAINVGLLDTQGLPDVILGNDFMSALGQNWYFDFDSSERSIIVFLTPFDDGSETQ